jgi:pimeloyl-ACP methyl ester carboxylesterase
MTLELKRTLTAGAAALVMVLPGLAPSDAQGATVKVPVDRANPAAGSLSLYVERQRARDTRRRTLLYVAGGPGSAATAEAADVLGSLGDSVRRSTELVAFDARGTGKSDLISCPALQKDRTLRSTAAAASCAASLGAKRSATVVEEQVDDIEAVRRALKISKWSVLGVSYGTEVAQRYAQKYPAAVDRMILDSVLPPEGPSAVSLEVFGGMPRVLRALCARKRCAAGVPSALDGVTALVPQLRASPLTGRVFDARGRARSQVLDPVAVLDILLAGDFNPALRLALPSAVAAARAGDPAPLLRLKALDQAATPLPQADSFSVGQYAATSCESLDLPWDGPADIATRRAQATERLTALGSALAPFDAQTVLDGDFLPLCVGWPAPAHPYVAPPRAMPSVRALYIAGEEDLRTPLESARDSASRNTAGRLLRVGGVGHSVLTSDGTGCAARAARRFLTGSTSYRPPSRCAGPDPYVPPVPLTPRSSSDAAFGPAGSVNQKVRRTLRVIDATLNDAIVAISAGPAAGGGLYGGSYRARAGGIALDDYVYVPGVRVTLQPLKGQSARIRVRGSGVLSGTVTLRKSGRVSGTLGGRRITGALPAGPPAL